MIESEKEQGIFAAGGARLFYILLICLVVYGVGSARTGFLGKDELRYAQIAKEMQNVGDYFFLHYEGEIYPDKPPLYFWMARASYAVAGGVCPWGIRAPLIVCTLLTVLLTFDIGRRFFGRRAGWLAALFFGLSFRPIWSAHSARLDPPLVLFTTLAIWFAVRGLSRVDEGRRPRPLDVAGFWSAAALGFLVKGPLGLIVPGGVVLTYACVRRKARGLVGWTTLAGVAIFFAVILALWVLPGMYFGGKEGYFQTIWEQEIIGRSAHPWRHVKEGVLNWVYYFGRLLPEFLPGSLFLPAILALAWRRRRENDADRRGLIFTLCWFFFILIFFTLMKSKRGQYILPLYPAGGLLVGWFFDRLLGGEKMRRAWTTVPFASLGGLALVVALGIQFPIPAIEKKFGDAMCLSARIAGLIALLGVAGAIFHGWRRSDLRWSIGGALALVPAVICVGFLFLIPRVTSDKPGQEVAAWFDERTDPGDVVFSIDSVSPEWNIWGDYFLRHIGGAYAAKKFNLKVEDAVTVDPEATQDLDESALEERQRKDREKKLVRDALQAFFQSEEPLLMISSKDDFEKSQKRDPKLPWRVLKQFSLPNNAEERELVVLSNQENYSEARASWQAKREREKKSE